MAVEKLAYLARNEKNYERFFMSGTECVCVFVRERTFLPRAQINPAFWLKGVNRMKWMWNKAKNEGERTSESCSWIIVYWQSGTKSIIQYLHNEQTNWLCVCVLLLSFEACSRETTESIFFKNRNTMVLKKMNSKTREREPLIEKDFLSIFN